jgi:hypothetical protein
MGRQKAHSRARSNLVDGESDRRGNVVTLLFKALTFGHENFNFNLFFKHFLGPKEMVTN